MTISSRLLRSWLVGLALAAATVLLPRDALAQEGEWLYAARGCLGCHGASGTGGVGPDIGRTALSFDDVLRQVREPRGIMPAFPEEVVTRAELEAIYGFLQDVPPPPPPIGPDPPQGEQTRASCAECHANHAPTIVRQFQSSAMGLEGNQNPRVDVGTDQITCADCHGTDHTLITRSKGRVPETTCATCHPQIYQEHVVDGGHSYGPGPGDLGINWERNVAVPHYAQMPRKVMEMGCDPCHAQAGATDAKYWDEEAQQYIDTSSLTYRNGCIACHTRHAFDLVEARKPEACYTCHMGPDHPNYEAYMSSKHGSIYVAKGAEWDFTVPMAEATWDAPTCAYCHMLHVEPDGTKRTTHHMTDKIIWGMGVQAAAGELADLPALEEHAPKREAMIRTCLECHSEVKAREYLRAADAHKLAGDALVIDARNVLQGLYADELIDPSHGRRAAGLLPGPRYSALELPGGFAQHWPAGLYYDVTAVEREYFDMFFFTNLKSYKGAFHMSPDYAWWYGYADTLGHLASIRDEEQQLRDAARTRKWTNFMLATGPLMVLAVLAALAIGRRLMKR